MTPLEIETMARRRYNAVGSTFWTEIEMWGMMDAAGEELAVETQCIERTFSTTTVADTQEYSFPAYVIMTKRLTWYGSKLEPIDMRQGDALTLNENGVSITGTPAYYAQFNDTFILYPTPNDAQELKVWGVVQPQPITSASATLEIPSWTHTRLVNFILAEMYAKDKDFNSASYFRNLWEQDKAKIRQWMKKKRRGDAPANVKDVYGVNGG